MMLRELRNLPAPAKLNLFLHVTGRRADGYHLLETVFELIDLHDRIDLVLRDDAQIVLRSPLPGVPPETDLTVRAARLLAAQGHVPRGVEIDLTKTLPIGGGLGGGSSDAATVLMGLNRLWGLRLARQTLMALGAQLGADVPFFIYGRTAYATGVGEKLLPLPLKHRSHVLIAPQVSVATAEIFRAPELTRDTKPLKIFGLSRGRQVFRGKNDLQPVVVGRYPEVARALNVLQQAAARAGLAPELARMSGSGSCVFLPVDSEQAAARLKQDLHERSLSEGFGRVLLTRSTPRHPLGDEWFLN